MGDESNEILFAPRASNTLSRTARLASIGFKEREFSLGSGLGVISIFRDLRVSEKFSVILSGNPVSNKTQLKILKISLAFGFILEQEKIESPTNKMNVWFNLSQ